MNRYNFFIVFALLFFFRDCSLAQLESNREDCNQKLRFEHLTKKLEPNICIPKGYQIISIFDDEDLNNDGMKDKVIQWQKNELIDGDTIFYSFYMQKRDSSYVLFKTLANLKPLYFQSYAGEYEVKNQLLDSLRRSYIYPSLSEIEFNNDIIIKFFTEAVVFKKLFFTYSDKHKTWVLTKEQVWFKPNRYEDELEEEIILDVGDQIKLEDLDIVEYIYM